MVKEVLAVTGGWLIGGWLVAGFLGYIIVIALIEMILKSSGHDFKFGEKMRRFIGFIVPLGPIALGGAIVMGALTPVFIAFVNHRARRDRLDS